MLWEVVKTQKVGLLVSFALPTFSTCPCLSGGILSSPSFFIFARIPVYKSFKVERNSELAGHLGSSQTELDGQWCKMTTR